MKGSYPLVEKALVDPMAAKVRLGWMSGLVADFAALVLQRLTSVRVVGRAVGCLLTFC